MLTTAAHLARDKDEEKTTSTHAETLRSRTPPPESSSESDGYASDEDVRGAKSDVSLLSQSHDSSAREAATECSTADTGADDFVPPLRFPAAPADTFTEVTQTATSRAAEPKYQQREHYKSADESYMGEAEHARER